MEVTIMSKRLTWWCKNESNKFNTELLSRSVFDR